MEKSKDFEIFGALMGMLGENFDKELSPLKVELYFDCLNDFEIEKVKKAVFVAIKTLKFFPKVAELRELIQGGPARSSDWCPHCKERMADCYDHWFCINCQLRFPKPREIGEDVVRQLEDYTND